jgi:hypothetical protein
MLAYRNSVNVVDLVYADYSVLHPNVDPVKVRSGKGLGADVERSRLYIVHPHYSQESVSRYVDEWRSGHGTTQVVVVPPPEEDGQANRVAALTQQYAKHGDSWWQFSLHLPAVSANPLIDPAVHERVVAGGLVPASSPTDAMLLACKLFGSNGEKTPGVPNAAKSKKLTVRQNRGKPIWRAGLMLTPDQSRREEERGNLIRIKDFRDTMAKLNPPAGKGKSSPIKPLPTPTGKGKVRR